MTFNQACAHKKTTRILILVNFHFLCSSECSKMVWNVSHPFLAAKNHSEQSVTHLLFFVSTNEPHKALEFDFELDLERLKIPWPWLYEGFILKIQDAFFVDEPMTLVEKKQKKQKKCFRPWPEKNRKFNHSTSNRQPWAWPSSFCYLRFIHLIRLMYMMTLKTKTTSGRGFFLTRNDVATLQLATCVFSVGEERKLSVV